MGVAFGRGSGSPAVGTETALRYWLGRSLLAFQKERQTARLMSNQLPRSRLPQDWRPATPIVPPPPDPPFLRDPARLLLAFAAFGMIVGCLLPWAVGTDGMGRPDAHRPTMGTAEGVWIIGGGITLAFLARGRLIWETTSRLLQLLPLAIAALSAIMWVGASYQAGQAIVTWTRRGGGGETTPVPLLALAGIVAAFAAAGWLERRRPADVRAATRGLAAELGFTRRSAGKIGLTLVLGLCGAAAGIAVGVVIGGPLREMSGATLLAIILAVFGLFIGIGLGIYAGDRLPGPRPGPPPR